MELELVIFDILNYPMTKDILTYEFQWNDFWFYFV
jgi:hypothetical protein